MDTLQKLFIIRQNDFYSGKSYLELLRKLIREIGFIREKVFGKEFIRENEFIFREIITEIRLSEIIRQNGFLSDFLRETAITPILPMEKCDAPVLSLELR